MSPHRLVKLQVEARKIKTTGANQHKSRFFLCLPNLCQTAKGRLHSSSFSHLWKFFQRDNPWMPFAELHLLSAGKKRGGKKNKNRTWWSSGVHQSFLATSLVRLPAQSPTMWGSIGSTRSFSASLGSVYRLRRRKKWHRFSRNLCSGQVTMASGDNRGNTGGVSAFLDCVEMDWIHR